MKIDRVKERDRRGLDRRSNPSALTLDGGDKFLLQLFTFRIQEE